MSVLNAVLGGGMSSRLFQEIRERRGLAYSVYSFASGYSDAGYFGLYAGCAPGKVDEVVALLRAGLEELAERRRRRRGAGPRARARSAAASCSAWRTPARGCPGSAGPSSSTASFMSTRRDRWPRSAPWRAEQVQALAAELAGRPRSLAVVGPFDPDRDLRRVAGLSSSAAMTHGWR